MTNVLANMINFTRANGFQYFNMLPKQSLIVLVPFTDRNNKYGVEEFEVFNMKELRILLGY